MSAWQTAMKSNYDVKNINKTKTQFWKFINRFGWNWIIVYWESILCCPSWTLDKYLNLFHLLTVANQQPPNTHLWSGGICSLQEQWRPVPEWRWFIELPDGFITLALLLQWLLTGAKLSCWWLVSGPICYCSVRVPGAKPCKVTLSSGHQELLVRGESADH